MPPSYLMNADDVIPEHGIAGYAAARMSSSVTGGSRDSPHEMLLSQQHDEAGRLRLPDDFPFNAFTYGPFKGMGSRPGEGLQESSSAQNNIFQRIREARVKADQAKRREPTSPEAEDGGLAGGFGEPDRRPLGATATQPFTVSKFKTAASGTTTMAGRATRGSLMQAPGSRAQQPDQVSDYSDSRQDQRQSQGPKDARARYQSQIARSGAGLTQIRQGLATQGAPRRPKMVAQQ